VPEKLCPRDADEEEEHGGVDDMTKLTYLNEPGVLYNLQRRYALNDIYVWTSQSVPFFFCFFLTSVFFCVFNECLSSNMVNCKINHGVFLSKLCC
jgi:hypothetical protein